MAVVEEDPIASSVANGVTTSFPFSFSLRSAADLVVTGTLDGIVTTYSLGVHYTVSGVGGGSGSADFLAAPASGTIITRYRRTQLVRSTDYQDNGDLPADTLNADFDRLWQAVQELESGSRAPGNVVRVPAGQTLSELPAAADRANRYLRFDSAGQLVLDIADPAMGAALNGSQFDATLNYVAGTLGAHTIGDPVDPHDFPWLAVGDGSADDAAKLNAALAYAASSGRRIVQLRNKTYRVTAPILLNSQGLQLRGVGQLATTLLIDHTSGPGVNISQPYCQLSDLTVRASTTRADFTTGTTYELATGLFGVQIYNNGGFMTQTRIDRVWSMSHPNNGFYMGGEGADSMFINCAAYSNRGHGFYFDGRTLLGGTASRCGLLSLIHCRATDNGGNAIYAEDSSAPCYRMWFHNFETINNAWNTSISGLINAEIRVGGENQHFSQCAVSDQNGDTVTVTGQGRPRLAKSVLSAGIYIGGNSRGITLTQNRFISTRRGVQTAASVTGLHLYVRGAYFTQQQTSGGASNQLFGFDIGSGYQCLSIEVESGMPVNNMVLSPTTSGTCRVGDVENLVYGNSTGSFFRRTPGYQNATIASNSVNAQSVNVNLQTGAATNLVAIVFAGGANPLPPGETLHFFNGSAFTVTLKHGTLAGYIRTKSGADVTVPAGGRFSIVTDASGNPWEL